MVQFKDKKKKIKKKKKRQLKTTLNHRHTETLTNLNSNLENLPELKKNLEILNNKLTKMVVIHYQKCISHQLYEKLMFYG